MRKCVFLSMDNLEGFPRDDELLIPALKQLGWNASQISWHRDDVNWHQFEIAIIRSTWDYQDHLKVFQSFLETIDKSMVHLENDFDTVLWNMDKMYLKDLDGKGIDIVPTAWGTSLDRKKMLAFFEQFDCEKMVIKPTVGASAKDTFLVSVGDDVMMHRLEAVTKERSFMVQTFMDQVLIEGEFSLVFFDNRFSHAVLKRPKPGDFRVQEEYGGKNTAVVPDPLLLQQAQHVLSKLNTVPLYARIDFVRSGHDFLLMELELVEPSFYLEYDPRASARFAQAVDRRMR